MADEGRPPQNLHASKPKTFCECICMCAGYFCPCFLLLIVLALAGSYNTFFILACINCSSSWQMIVSILCIFVGNLFLGLFLWSFYAVVFTCAGYVTSEEWKYPPQYCGDNPQYKPPTLDGTTESQENMLNPHNVTDLDRNKQIRYCNSCNQYKPDKAYHCSWCQRCTYNFDHHCPVVNNCIGRDNYKLFVVFLMYGGIASLVDGCVMLIGVIFVYYDASWWMLWLMPAGVMLVLAVTLLLFGGVHVSYLCKGESTMSRHISSASGERQGFPGFRLPCARNGTSEEDTERRVQERLKKRRRQERHWNEILGLDRCNWRTILPLKPRRRALLAAEM